MSILDISRRKCIWSAATSMAAVSACSLLKLTSCRAGQSKVVQEKGSNQEPFFKTRGVVLGVQDMTSLNWPQMAKDAGLSTIGTHVFPAEIAGFVRTEAGRKFLKDCRELGIEVEHELHSMNDLLPRDLYKKDQTMFRMDEKENRVKEWNLCVHSKNAIDLICENAVKYAQLLRPTTGRYFFWIDDAKPMCRCPKCKPYSDSDQALILENEVLNTLRAFDKRATLAHLAYMSTIKPPTQVEPLAGIFLEFAPIRRTWDKPLSDHDAIGRHTHYGKICHGDYLHLLDANLDVFGKHDAQDLEYWLDASLFSGWNRSKKVKLPWNRDVFLDDVQTYAKRGIRHITSFGVYLDSDYVRQFGQPPINEYGQILKSYDPRSQPG